MQTYDSRDAKATLQAISLNRAGWPWLIAREHAAALCHVFAIDIQRLVSWLGL